MTVVGNEQHPVQLSGISELSWQIWKDKEKKVHKDFACGLLVEGKHVAGKNISFFVTGQ